MSAIRRRFDPRRLFHRAVGFFGLLGLAAAIPAMPAQAAAPHYSDILPVSRVKPGMEGYGLTTFKGTTVSRFHVVVTGILKNANAGRDLIVIHMEGGPITERGANIIEGMSGSPIYIGGKVIGAVAYGLEFPKEPIALVTPIEDMLDAWDPNIPQQPSYFAPADKHPSQTARKGEKTSANRPILPGERLVTLPRPMELGGRRVTRIALRTEEGAPPAANDVAVFRQATGLFTVSDGTDSDRAWLQKELRRRGYAVTVMRGAGGGHKADFKGAPLHPGSVFGTLLASGDIEFGGFGTITYRKGNRILGFGHPLMRLGALEGAITSAKVVDIFSSELSSQIMAISGPIIGTLRQDRDFSVSGDLGNMPHLIPFDVTVHDETTGREQTIRTRLFQHPDLSAPLLNFIARAAVERVHSVPGDVMARVTTTVDADEVGSVTRTNLIFDSSDISTAATQDLTDITGIVSGNPFYPLPIRSAKMRVDISAGHDTATLERIFLKQGRYAPGDTLDIGAVLKPYRRDPITLNIPVKVPSDLPTGRYQLIVRGGMPNVIRFGGLVLTAGNQETQTPPVNVRQMVARLNERESNTDLVARLILNTVAPALEGEKLSELPPNLSALMRSDRNSGVRLERDEVRAMKPTQYVTSGMQQLIVTVVRKNTQEPGNGGSFGGPSMQSSPGGAPGLPPGVSNVTGLNASDDSASVGSDDSEDSSEEGDQNAAHAGRARVHAEAPLLWPLETQRWNAALEDDQTAPAPPAETKPKNDKKQNGRADKKDGKGKGNTTTPTPPVPVTITPTPKTDDSSNDKPVGRQLQVWRQTARADFAPGKFTGTSVTANGELRLARTLRQLATTSETYVWSLVADGKGNLYAGTGTTGKILKIDSDGKVTTFATLPVVAVQSLLLGKDGTLWAGSGVKGNLYKIAPDGTFTQVCSLPEKYILALAQDSQGNLYIGPGGGGTIYKLAPGATGKDAAVPFLKTTADHIMAIVVDSKDNLYVGTGNDGIVYKVAPNGKSSVLYDAKENAITALAVDAADNIYAGTGPKGLLYRITPDGSATVVYDHATSFYTAIQPAPDGTFYASSVNAIYHVFPSASAPNGFNVQPLDNPKDVDFLALAVTPDGNLYAGTGNIGEIYTSSTAPQVSGPQSGTFESVVHDARLTSRWGTLRWNAQLPTGSQLRVETRTGNVAEPDSTWNAWSPIQMGSGSASEGAITSPPARFIQYRLTLESNSAGGQPAVREVSLDYLPRNQAPKVAFQAPAGGERWAKSQTIRWSGDDPDHDTLTYDVYYSNDAGATWKPLTGSSKTTTTTTITPVTENAPASDSSADSASSTDSTESSDTTTSSDTSSSDASTDNAIQTIVVVAKQPKDDPSLPATMRQILNEAKAQQSGGSASSSMHATSTSWDTKTVPDGTYWLKVVASDRESNPTDPMTAEAISEPFIVCNAQPAIRITARQVLGSSRTFTLEGTVTQPLIAVTAVQYRVDGGDWIAAVPKDGLFDTSQEGFTLATSALTSGKHTVEVKAFNAAGGTATEKLDVTVP